MFGPPVCEGGRRSAILMCCRLQAEVFSAMCTSGVRSTALQMPPCRRRFQIDVALPPPFWGGCTSLQAVSICHLPQGHAIRDHEDRSVGYDRVLMMRTMTHQPQ